MARVALVTGGTRAGKGRGHVIPSLLNWTGSAVVHDPKGELWRESAGWRSGFSHVLFFNPRDPASVRLNPLAEIQPGPQEVAQVQRLVSILADPGGAREDEAVWDKAASEILEALILHVLYTAADEDKSLPTVARLLAAIDTALPRPEVVVDVVIPYDRGDLVAVLHERADVERVEYLDAGTAVVGKAYPSVASLVAPYNRVAP